MPQVVTETEFRDMRQRILNTHDHRCHYCQSNAHQIVRTTTGPWVPACRHCQHTINTHHFPTEAARRHFIAKHPPKRQPRRYPNFSHNHAKTAL